MSDRKQELEEMIQAVCWKLYLEPNSPQLEAKWKEFEKSTTYREQISRVCEFLTNICQRLLASSLGLKSISKAEEDIQSLGADFLKEILNTPSSITEEKLENWHRIVKGPLKEIVCEAIRKALSQSPELDFKQPQSYENNINELDAKIAARETEEASVITNYKQLDAHRDDDKLPPTEQIATSKHSPIPTYSPPDTTSRASKNRNNLPRDSKDKNQPFPIEETSTPAVAQWKYLPLPNDEPDKHDEYYFKSGKSPDGLKLIGARVRGKMHKHNGTNCDDWFEFAVSGAWTIIAVSDGAGSKKFSRVGAKISCQAAVYDLAEKLKAIEIKARETKEALQADLGQEADWAFIGKDIDSAQNALHEAMKVAYDAVNKKAEECDKLKDYYKALGNRDIDIKDFSATLLLAVHTTIKVGENQYSLVLTCQVGDGILAAISKEGTLKLLGKPDSGQFAGQTEFLTSKKKLDRENLIKKTFVFPGNLKALMVMTDGVADDYFPNDPRILDLYGDLVLNQVIGIRKPDDSEISGKLRPTNLGSLTGVQDAKQKFQVTQQAITPDGTKDVKISYVDAYAKELGVSPQNVVASSALLWAGATGEPMCDECKDKPPEEKLRIWLDSYYHRGSFDDRTLVVLYREEV